jgi:hypothetical protein
LYQLGGTLLIVFGLAGGTAFLPFDMGLYISIQSYRADVGLIIAGAVLLVWGARLIDRPWTEKVGDRKTG